MQNVDKNLRNVPQVKFREIHLFKFPHSAKYIFPSNRPYPVKAHKIHYSKSRTGRNALSQNI